ncbi:MAG: glutamate 5-kinase [Eubacterium sp.]|nr:glutamate 5-kinase [Eubacterium sp.]
MSSIEYTRENLKDRLKEKRRIVIKIGSSSLVHKETGEVDFMRIEKLIRILSDLKNQGKDVVLVSSGAIVVGCKTLGLKKRPEVLSMKQACAALGQLELMMLYQKLFLEYNHRAAQVLLTFDVISNQERRMNATNTLKQLLDLDVIPVVNENDTVATEEIEFGDNDTLSAIVASLIDADLLVLLTDIDGLYTDDPRKNPEARKLSVVERIDDKLLSMGKNTNTGYGTGGMATKLSAARIATDSGADMAICESTDLEIILRLLEGEDEGTLFLAHNDENFDITDFIINKKYLNR